MTQFLERRGGRIAYDVIGEGPFVVFAYLVLIGSLPGACSRVSHTASAHIVTQYATVNGLVVAYKTYGSEHEDPILLIGGTGMQLIDWPDALLHELVNREYRVVAFDNRDVGLSTHLEHLGCLTRRR